MEARKILTVKDAVQNKIRKVKNWEAANPGLPWVSPEYHNEDPKIYIQKELLSSKAYRSLSRVAMLVYQDFLAKREMISVKRNKKKVWEISNNGKIIYPYEEAIQNGFSRTQFRNAIDELQEKGLIDIAYLGKGGRKPAKGTGDVTRYWIDDRYVEYGTDEFRPPRNPRVKDTRKTRGFALLMSDPIKAKKIIEKRKKTVLKNSLKNRL